MLSKVFGNLRQFSDNKLMYIKVNELQRESSAYHFLQLEHKEKRLRRTADHIGTPIFRPE